MSLLQRMTCVSTTAPSSSQANSCNVRERDPIPLQSRTHTGGLGGSLLVQLCIAGAQLAIHGFRLNPLFDIFLSEQQGEVALKPSTLNDQPWWRGPV
jgi:hypothetical protein